MFNPRASRELALNQSVLSAMTVNAINGTLLMTTFLLQLRTFVPISLMLLLAVLFGPFAGLAIPIIYTRIELWVGKKLGGKASFDDLYRIFAWAFFPAGLALALSKFIILLFINNGTLKQGDSISFPPLPEIMTFLCFLGILCFAIRNYCTNVISVHQISKHKGALSILITLVLFVIMPVWLIVIFSVIKQLVKKYRSKENCCDDNGNRIRSTGVIRAGIAICLFYLALFSWLALYDEKPDPLMVKELNTPAPDIFRNDNAWLALLGFTSSTEDPPFVNEEDRLRNLKSAFLRGENNACAEGSSEKQKTMRISFKGKIPEVYGRKDNGIWEYVLAHNAEVDNFLRDNKDLLRRYEKLYNYHQYLEPLDYGFCAPVPQFSPIRNIQKIKFMQIARIAQNGNFNDALIGIQNDAEFWRVIAGESNTLISKLISIAMLSSDIRFVAELCAHHHLDLKQWETVRTIMRPFNRGETSLAKAFHGEARMVILGLESSFKAEIKLPPSVFFPILKQNATRNRLYSAYKEHIELSKMMPQTYAAVVTRKNIIDTDQFVKFSFLYNPVGEILAGIAIPSISGYVEKTHDLEGLRRLALLKVLSSMESVASENMQQFINTHRGDLGNPYTGASMNWDSQKKSIYFKQVREGKPVEIFM